MKIDISGQFVFLVKYSIFFTFGGEYVLRCSKISCRQLWCSFQNGQFSSLFIYFHLFLSIKIYNYRFLQIFLDFDRCHIQNDTFDSTGSEVYQKVILVCNSVDYHINQINRTRGLRIEDQYINRSLVQVFYQKLDTQLLFFTFCQTHLKHA